MHGFCPLASGSRGNAIFLGTDRVRLLIDAGTNCATLEERLAEIGVALNTIDAILLTHEHIDHISSIPVLVEKCKIPVFANAETAKGLCEALGYRPRFKIFTTGEPFSFEGLEIFPFSIPHDTLDPVAFTVRTQGMKLGFCTDLGYAPSMVAKELQLCDYLYVEANHQPSMVHSSHRPAIYKKRVLSRQGHLSNQDCAALIASVFHSQLKHVHLAHLSGECNTPEVALQVVGDFLAAQGKTVPLSIAWQDRSSQIVLF